MATKATPAAAKRPAAAAARVPARRGKNSGPKTASTFSGLASAGSTSAPAEIDTAADSRSSEKKSRRVKPVGGFQLPQGANAYRAAIYELMRTKAAKIIGKPAEEILNILIKL